MTEEFSWLSGMSVDLITAPGDIRITSIQKVGETCLTLRQTVPPLDGTFLDHTVLMAFTDGVTAVRSGCKARVIDLGFSDDGTQEAVIIIEKGAAIAACDLRKYPRFNPGLFDDVHIVFNENTWELTDISAGGARGLCRQGDLDYLTRGDIIRLTVGIGTQNHHVDAQVMRVNHAITKGGHWELAVAFMAWDQPLADALRMTD
jgi:hypothetical protein